MLLWNIFHKITECNGKLLQEYFHGKKVCRIFWSMAQQTSGCAGLRGKLLNFDSNFNT
jgi:hypothetical protein